MHYTTHKKQHGNNHQGLTTPDGLLIEMFGPFEGRTNDKKMLRSSNLLNRMAHYFPGYCLFGDKGYDHGHPSLQVPFKGAHLTPAQTAYNLTMSRIRQPVEWSFGKVVVLWAGNDRLSTGPPVASRSL